MKEHTDGSAMALRWSGRDARLGSGWNRNLREPRGRRRARAVLWLGAPGVRERALPAAICGARHFRFPARLWFERG